MNPLFTLLSVTLFFCTMASQSMARGHGDSHGVEVDMMSDHRGLLQQFAVRSQRANVSKSYVIARDNDRYSIRVNNTSGERIGVVVTVDGRNIISGKKSNLRTNERMYILPPYQSQTYEGWRTGRNHVNRFHFTGMSDSYAADWGDHSAPGVVAVAVFKERHLQKKKNAQKNWNRSKRSALKEGPGTGFGKEKWSPSREVHFVAQKHASEKHFIKYEWKATLCKMQLIQCRPQREQNRFWPKQPRRGGFTPLPSWSLHLRF